MQIDLPWELQSRYTASRSYVEILWNWKSFIIGIQINTYHLGYTVGWKIDNWGHFSKEMYTLSQYPREVSLFIGPLTLILHWCKIIATEKKESGEGNLA